jgi:4-hydroxy-2-oxoheptanedioate aldolase
MSPDHVIARTSARLRELWSRDLPAFGLWSTLRDTAVAEMLAGSRFDYVCIDLQHGTADFADLPTTMQAMRAADHAPLVRLPWNDPAGVMRALDAGACAVVVPMVDDAAQAAAAASASRFPPDGSRSWGPMWGQVRADGAPSPAEQNAATLCLVMIETSAGVAAVEEIVRVPGIDGVYIGPNDLALGCGHGRATYRDSPDVDALIERLISTCRDAGLVAGLHCSDVEMAVHWAGRGARMLTVAQDGGLLRAGLERTWSALSEATDLTRTRAAP